MHVVRYGARRLSAAALIMLAGCGQSGGGPPGGMMQVNVVAVNAQARPIEEAMSFVGNVAANESVEIRSEIDGTVEEIGFEEGQAVKQGAVLFRIDERKLQASLQQAEANLKLAQATLDRYRGLVETGAVSRQEFDRAVSELEANAAAVQLLLEQLSDATIEAPFAGFVGARRVSAGQYVSRGAALTTVVSQDPVKIEFPLPERFLAQLSMGQMVKLAVSPYPDRTFTGEVFFIAPQVDEATRTVAVKARVANPDGLLRHGMFAQVDWIARLRERAIVIPETALIVQGDTVMVYVVDGGTAQARPVTTGLRLAGTVEISSGLSGGETVIIEGTQKIGPGSKVALRLEEPPGVDSTPKPAVTPIDEHVKEPAPR